MGGQFRACRVSMESISTVVVYFGYWIGVWGRGLRPAKANLKSDVMVQGQQTYSILQQKQQLHLLFCCFESSFRYKLIVLERSSTLSQLQDVYLAS